MSIQKEYTKKDDGAVKKLEEAFVIGADVSSACSYANISRQTYYNWIEEDKELKERFDSLREKPVLKAYQTVASNLSDINTAKWYLERKRKDEFSTRVENDDLGKGKEIDELKEKLKNWDNEDNQAKTDTAEGVDADK